MYENPLCLLLPRDEGAKEWGYEIRKPEDNVGAKEETIGEMMGRAAKNPLSAAPIVMSMFSTRLVQKKEDQFEVRSIHLSPYDPVRVVNAVP